MRECNQVSFRFARHFLREVKAEFAGGTISSDGGAVLLREADRQLKLLEGFAGCFSDARDPRYVTHLLPETSVSAESWPAQKLYEEFYCARGDMENRIKEQFSLFAGRVSAESLRANQMRIYFSAIGYILLQGLRRLGREGNELAQAQCSTLRLKLLKVGALIRISVRRVHLLLASGYPDQDLFRRIYLSLQVGYLNSVRSKN